MQSFLDRERDLSWITFKSYEYQTQSYLSLIDKLNSWKSESLNRFILDCETENLGDLLSGYLSKCEESKIFFAFDKQSLIDKNPLGIVILEPQTDLYAESEFKKYIRECIKDKSMKKAGKLSLIKTIRALIKQTDSNNMNIDYLIINPNNENKGVATRMISSITKNAENFNNGEVNVLSASVHKNNIASQQVFIKNNFAPLTSKDSDFLTDYYFVK